MARPVCATTARRWFPSRNEAAIPRTKTLVVNVTSCPSMNESPTPSSQNAAGAAKGKRRRAKSGSTSTAIAGTLNHSVVCGTSGAPRRKATSNMASIASSTISTSNPYLRASDKRPFTCRTYATPALTASYQSRTPRRRVLARHRAGHREVAMSFDAGNRLRGRKHGDGVNRDKQAAGQRHVGRRGASWRWVGHEARVDRVDGREVLHVGVEDGGLDQGLQRCPGGGQDRIEVTQCQLGLRLDAVTGHAGGRIDTRRARAEYEAGGHDRLAVGSQRRRRVVGGDCFPGHLALSLIGLGPFIGSGRGGRRAGREAVLPRGCRWSSRHRRRPAACSGCALRR